MKLFLVKIRRETRGGNFQELYSRAVSVSDDKIDNNNVKRYFQDIYEGFVILVTEAKEIKDITNKLPMLPKNGAGTLADFFIKYTDEEKQLHKEYEQHMDLANELIRKIQRSIMDRYGKLSYINHRFSIGLFTDRRGTVCTKLPINSQDFFKVVKTGVESVDEKKELKMDEISESFEPSFDDPLPSEDTLVVEKQLIDDSGYPDIPF